MNRHIRLTEDFAKDLNWFTTFLCSYNGVTFYDNKPAQATIALAVFLTGLGVVFKNMVYALPLPNNYLGYDITQFEMLNIIVALKVWGHSWQDLRIEIKSDNLAVLQVLQEGKARDPLLVTTARNIWMLTSLFNIHLSVSHIAGYCRDQKLISLLPQFVWVPTHIDLTKLLYLALFLVCFPGEHSITAQLATRASTRLFDAFRPATQKAYACMFREF